MALPYIDVEIDVNPLAKEKALRLIEEEIARSGGRDKLEEEYLSRLSLYKSGILPPPPLQAIDSQRYLLHQNTSNNRHIYSILEYEERRKQNLELMVRFGPSTLEAHAKRLQLDIEEIEQEATQLKNANSLLNQSRHHNQVQVIGIQLQEHQDEWAKLAKNTALLQHALLD